MKPAIILSCLLIITFTLHAPSLHRQEVMVGAYRDQDVNNLEDDLKEIDTYLKNLFPDLQNTKLIRAETQVVEGINYRYTYSLNNVPNTTVSLTVWDAPWLNKRQITKASRQTSVEDENIKAKGEKVIYPKEGNYEEIKTLFQ